VDSSIKKKSVRRKGPDALSAFNARAGLRLQDIVSYFAKNQENNAGAKVKKALASAGTLFKADCCCLWLFNDDFSMLKKDREWHSQKIHGISSITSEISLKRLPLLFSLLKRRKPIIVPDIKKPAGKKYRELQRLCPVSCSSLLLTPVLQGKLMMGYLGVYSAPGCIPLHADAVSALSAFGDLCAMAITNTKFREEYTNEREAFHLLMNKLPDSIYFKDINSRFMQVNKALARRLHVTSMRGMIGKTDFDFFSSEHAQGAFDDEQKIIRTGKPLVGIVEKETFHDGSLKWVSTTKEPVYDKKRRIVGTFGISRDITDLKRAEDALLKANDALEKRVQIRTADLRTANLTLEHRITQLKFLNTISNKLAQFIHLDELYQAIIMAFLERLPRAEASLCLFSKNNFSCVYATPGLDNPRAGTASENFLSLIAARGFNQPLLIDQWQKDKQLGLFISPGINDLPCSIVVPLIADKTLLGAVQIFTIQEFVSLYQDEQEVFATLSVHAAVCLGKALHFKDLGEKARLQGELDAARSIQRKFISSYSASIPRINIKGAYFPANEVSGDYLDYFQTPSGRWVIVIADVCGKGVAAALVMAMLRTTFRAETRRIDPSGARELVLSVNEHFVSNLDVFSFVTVLCLVINAGGTSMTYTRAGHPNLLRLRTDTGAVEPVTCQGIAFGMIDNLAIFSAKLGEVTVPLVKNDRFFIYTDGLIDAFGPATETYGTKRLLAALAGITTPDPGDMIEKVMAEIKKFTKGAPIEDDLTMLAMTVTG
jgi:PAS domain S-box-containing protein